MHWQNKSLQLRHLDAGSCNGCEQELTALTSQAYDISQFGIDLVASPRHADALVVTGPVTDTMIKPLQKVWEAIPRPKRLVALGDCAAGCGVFQKAYACHGGVASAFGSPDLVIRGCPPQPTEMLEQLKRFQNNSQTATESGL
ncbi:oxidoreductase [Alicyclobacillaceae bacterium I2511]|nr:oxidoreductase [Alicyclobacillaceae bacterium I2511]